MMISARPPIPNHDLFVDGKGRLSLAHSGRAGWANQHGADYATRFSQPIETDSAGYCSNDTLRAEHFGSTSAIRGCTLRDWRFTVRRIEPNFEAIAEGFAVAPTVETRVFLIEDQALVRECLATLLELEPTMRIVGTAAQADEALLELETLEADVVLMDVRLPGISGIEATRVLTEKLPGLPVIVLTSYGDGYRRDAFDAGASGYMLKSCTRQELVFAIREVLARDGQVDHPRTDEPVHEQCIEMP